MKDGITWTFYTVRFYTVLRTKVTVGPCTVHKSYFQTTYLLILITHSPIEFRKFIVCQLIQINREGPVGVITNPCFSLTPSITTGISYTLDQYNHQDDRTVSFPSVSQNWSRDSGTLLGALSWWQVRSSVSSGSSSVSLNESKTRVTSRKMGFVWEQNHPLCSSNLNMG